jgi:hypothetical protein
MPAVTRKLYFCAYLFFVVEVEGSSGGVEEVEEVDEGAPADMIK